MNHVVNLAYLLLIAATFPYWLWKAATTGKYRRGLLARLLGVAPRLPPGQPVVWVHAVSVGEVLLLRPLLASLRRERPDVAVALSVTTATGLAVARDKYPDVHVFLSPLDFSWAVGRVLDQLRPSLLVLAELELWPNLLLASRRRGIPVAVVNARMSERSFRGYSRIRLLLQPALSAIRWWGAQNTTYADRITRLLRPGLIYVQPHPDTCIEVTGSMKYDNAVTDRHRPAVAALRRLFAIADNAPVLVAGSTMEPEEEIVVEAFQTLRQQHPSLRLLLVPRHPERFDAVAQQLERRGIRFTRRSRIVDSPCDEPVVLVDTVGELASIWGLATLGFVGGSLECQRGGQSMIEPAGYGVPVCFGPHTWNFRDTVERLLDVGGAVRIANRRELAIVLNRWLTNPSEATAIGEKARLFIQSQQGATERTWYGVANWLPQQNRTRRAA